ncbi:hypothetical protein Hanom_Chr04g00357851 [Helianthus anomalus]
MWSGWLRSSRSADNVTSYLHDPTFRMQNGISISSRIHRIHYHSILSFCYVCTNFCYKRYNIFEQYPGISTYLTL